MEGQLRGGRIFVKGLKIGAKITLANLLTLIILYAVSLIVIWYLFGINNDLKLKRFRETMLNERKHNLVAVVDMGYSILAVNVTNYITEKGKTREVLQDYKNEATGEIRNMRYDNGTGYLFINDTTKPFPHMVMHPTMPELNGRELDSPQFNTVGREKKNLFVAMNDLCETNGEGFIEYLWPKPVGNNLTEYQPKLTYVKLFKPWKWIIGSGLYIDDIDSAVNMEKSKIDRDSIGLYNSLTIIMAAVTLFMLIFLYFISNRMTNPLKQMIKSLDEITEGKGDLTNKIVYTGKDEIGELGQSFNKLLGILKSDLDEVASLAMQVRDSSGKSQKLMDVSIKPSLNMIKETTHTLNIESENSTSGIEELSATLEEVVRNIESIMTNMVKQASAVEEGSSSIEEMARNIENTAEMSNKTKSISQNLNSVSIEGSSAVKASITSIREVAEYSQQILKLLGLISNITKQTNLLAMNAAIEAAHAGEAGKGFAIVADEIRRLSEDTNKNARDIGDVVATIVGRIDDSVRLAEKAGVGLDMITAYSQQNVQIISQLNVAVAEQNNGAKEILKSTQDLVKITEEVKLSMVEQKDATLDFSGALKDLRKLALENKESTKKHIETLNSLLQTIEEISANIQDNTDKGAALGKYADKYVHGNNGTAVEKTGLKLVE